jgi:outer membrane protein assembly factor BamB
MKQKICVAILFSLAAFSSAVAQDEVASKSKVANSDNASASASASNNTEDAARKLVDWPLARGNANSTGAFPESVGDEFEIEWEAKYPKGAFESSPIIVSRDGDSTVYVAGINVDVKGALFAFDLKTGTTKWTFEIDEGFVAPPAWHDGKIYAGDMAGMVYCVDESGKKVWQYETKGEISSSPNFFGSVVLIGSQDATLYALDQKTGELVWSHPIEEQIQCGATIAGDRCFLAGCDAKLHIVDLNSGKEVDTVEIGSPTGTTAAVLGDAAYFGTEQGTFFSIDYKAAKALWQFVDPKGATSIRSSAAVTSDRVIFGARNRKVSALNPKDGTELWSTTLKAKIDGSPIIAGDRVYVGSTDGRLYTLDLADGKILWKKEFGGSFMGGPAIVGGASPRLVVATERGVVYCLKSTKTKRN